MRLCFICSEYPPVAHGGIGSVTESLARALVVAGHQVRVVGLYRSVGSKVEYDEQDAVQVWRLGESDQRLGWLRARYRLYELVSGWCANREIDLIEVPDYHGLAAFWQKLPVPLVVRLHGSSSYFSVEMGRRPDTLSYWIERSSLRRSDFTCAVSRYVYEQTKTIFNDCCNEAEIIYNPVQTTSRVTLAQRSKQKIVFTGTLTPKKGIVSLIRAWPQVISQRYDAELHIYGKDGVAEDGRSMQVYLSSLLGDANRAGVHFHGHVSRDQVFQALREARVAVFPSYAESFGLAPIEAMSTGCPTIYSQRPPGPEIVRDDVDGRLVDPDKPQMIASAIIELLNKDDLARRFALAGYERVSRDFSLEKVLPKNESFYGRCIEQFRSPL